MTSPNSKIAAIMQKVGGIFDFGPAQFDISTSAIPPLIIDSNRRWRLADFEEGHCLKPAGMAGHDPQLRFPFRETFVPCFKASVEIKHIPFQSQGKACYTYLKEHDEEAIARVESWLASVKPHIGIRDLLAQCFAIDYDRNGGAPTAPYTELGAYRQRAKPYDGQQLTISSSEVRAMGKELSGFVQKVPSYRKYANAVVGMPPSDPSRTEHLAHNLASIVSDELNIPNLSCAVTTTSKRPSARAVQIEDKVRLVLDATSVDADLVRDKSVLLVDDVYQSGASMNVVAHLLQQAGARRISGLACVKTCRNSDNTSQ